MNVQWLPERTYSVTYPFVRMAQAFWLVGLISSLVNFIRTPDAVIAAFGIFTLLTSVVLYLLLMCLVAALACTFNRVIGLLLALVLIVGAVSVVTGLLGARFHELASSASFDQKALWATGMLSGGAYYLYVAQLGVRAGIMWAFCRRSVRIMVAELYGAPLFSLNTLSKIIGLPTSLEHIKLRRWQALILFAVSSICFAGVSVLLFVLPIAPSATLTSAQLPRSPSATWLPDYDRITVAAVNLVIVILAIIGLAILAGFVRRMGRRTVRSTLLERQALDARAPILFLRAFGDDQVALPPPRLPLLGYLYDVRNRQTSLDVMLLEEATDYGPVVALGNPKDPVPPYGAARGYFTDESWQEAVRRLARDSVALVICLDDTDGIWWEVAHIRESGLAAKTLFLLHPKFRGTSDAGDFLARAIERLGVKEQLDVANAAPRAPGSSQAARSAIGFFLGPDGTWQVGLSRAGSRIGYLLMLRWFLRTRLRLRSKT
jgi:hypothetical protein